MDDLLFFNSKIIHVKILLKIFTFFCVHKVDIICDIILQPCTLLTKIFNTNIVHNFLKYGSTQNYRIYAVGGVTNSLKTLIVSKESISHTWWYVLKKESKMQLLIKIDIVFAFMGWTFWFLFNIYIHVCMLSKAHKDVTSCLFVTPPTGWILKPCMFL